VRHLVASTEEVGRYIEFRAILDGPNCHIQHHRFVGQGYGLPVVHYVLCCLLSVLVGRYEPSENHNLGARNLSGTSRNDLQSLVLANVINSFPGLSADLKHFNCLHVVVGLGTISVGTSLFETFTSKQEQEFVIKCAD